MTCPQIEERLSAYLEGDLSAVETAAVADHLKVCPSCRRLAARLEDLPGELAALQEELPFFLKNRLLNIPETIAEERRNLARWVPWSRWIAAGIGTVLLSLNLFYFTNIVPPANRIIHRAASKVETLAAGVGGVVERLRESKDFLLYAFFPKKEDPTPGEANRKKAMLELPPVQGVHHG